MNAIGQFLILMLPPTSGILKPPIVFYYRIDLVAHFSGVSNLTNELSPTTDTEH